LQGTDARNKTAELRHTNRGYCNQDRRINHDVASLRFKNHIEEENTDDAEQSRRKNIGGLAAPACKEGDRRKDKDREPDKLLDGQENRIVLSVTVKDITQQRR